MKIVTIILVALTGALAFASFNLFSRLEAERTRADTEAALRQTWEKRAKELERGSRGRRFGDDTRAADASEGPAAQSPAGTDRSSSAQPVGGMPASSESRRERMELARRQRELFNPYSTPEGRELMRVQSKAANKRLYADLMRKLNLTPEETDAFLNVLADQQARENEVMQALFRQDTRPDRAAQQRLQNEMRAQTQTELASRLGSSRAEQYANYRASLPERMQVGQYADQLDALNLPLKEEQKDRFMTAMVEEKSATPEPEYPDFRDIQARETRLRWQEDYNRRLLDRTSAFLSADQHRHIEESLNWQLRRERSQLEQMNQARERRSDRQRQRSPDN